MAARGGSTVWLDVLPSLRGFGAMFAKEAAGAGSKAGKQLGTAIEDAVGKASKRAAEVLAENVEDASDRVKDAADGMSKAHDKVADAAGRVTVAEAKLADARKKHGETDARTIAAQERLATATRSKERADREATKASEDHERATSDLTEAQRRLTEETSNSDGALKRLTGSLSKVDTKQVDRGARSMTKFSAAAYASAAGIVAIGSSLPAIAGISTIMAQASGSALILPGVLTAGGVAAGTLKLGLNGVGAALKEWDDAEKFAEKIKELSVNARGFAVEVRALRPELIGLRNAVQDRLFAGAADDVKILGKTYIPVLRKELADVSGEFGLARQSLVGFAVQGGTVRDVTSILDLTEQQVHNVRGAVAPLAAAFVDLSIVGGEALARMTSGLDSNAAGFAAFIRNARETGQIEQWINSGLQALDDLGELFGNVGSIVSTVLGAANREGGSLLDTLNAVTGSVVAMLQSAQGQEALSTFFRTVHDTVEALLPGLRAVGSAVLDGIVRLGPEIPPVAQAFSDIAISVAPLIPDLVAIAVNILPPVVSLVRELAPAVGVLAAAFVGGYAALLAFNAAVAVFGAIRWIVGFIRAWTAGQLALNLAMTANPIGLIVAAIGALVAAVVWIATETTWFQDLWAFAWGWIKTIAVATWDVYLKPAFDAVVNAVRAIGAAAMWLWREAFVPAAEAIGTAAMWLWRNVLQPFFNFIDTTARIVAAVITTLFVAPAVIAFNLLSGAATWLWHNGLKPTFDAIAVGAMWLWRTVIEPFIALNVAAFRLLASVAMWLYTNGIKPAVDGIASAVLFMWDYGVKPTFDFLVFGFRLVGDIFAMVWSSIIKPAIDAFGSDVMWLWHNAILPSFEFIKLGIQIVGDAFAWVWNSLIKPAWRAFTSDLTWAYDTIIKPLFEGLKSGVGAVGDAFNVAVEWIGRIWDGLKSKLSGPVNFVINSVYNDGIRAVWNKVADFVGINGLPQMNAITFAGGGVISGYAPGRDIVPALLSPGEAVLVPEAVRLLGARNILALNAAASGRPGNVVGGGGFSGGGVVQRFAGGGVVGNLMTWVSGISDAVGELWRDPAGFVKARLGSSGFADLLARGPVKLLERGAAFLWEKVKDFFGFSSDAAAATAGAAGGSPQGWQQMWEIIRAQFPGAILTSSFRPGDPGYHGKGRAIDIAGPMGAINSWIAKVYPNSTQLIYTPGVNLLNGRPFAYDAPTQADHHDHVHWAFDSGGYLMPGVSTVYNGTGKPEPVLTSAQWEALRHNGFNSDSPMIITGRLDLGEGFEARIDGRISQSQQQVGAAIAARRRY